VLRRRRCRAHACLVAVLVGDHGCTGCLAVINDDSTRGDGGGDPLLGHLGRYPDVDVEPLTRGLVLVGALEP
jgi:hypothetical protein